MNYSCFACTNSAEFVCFCTSTPVRLCSDHVQNHMSSNRAIHIIEPASTAAPQCNNQEILKILNLKLDQFKEKNKKLNKALSTLTAFSIKTSKQLENSIKIFENIKKEVLITNRISFFNRSENDLSDENNQMPGQYRETSQKEKEE